MAFLHCRLRRVPRRSRDLQQPPKIHVRPEGWCLDMKLLPCTTTLIFRLATPSRISATKAARVHLPTTRRDGSVSLARWEPMGPTGTYSRSRETMILFRAE